MQCKRQLNTKISVMIILTMVLQLLVPISFNIYAHSEGSFRVVDERIENDKVYMNWEFD